MFKNALVSCSNKLKLDSFLAILQKQGLRIVSTGGTAKFLRQKGLTVFDVSEQTGFEEVMDGRVKTLHPNVHMALLARLGHPEDEVTLKKFNLQAFDLVIGNLYPFEEEPSVENIDIGGPSFLRAAAKNFERITTICNPDDYDQILAKKNLTFEDRKILAAKVFAHTSAYDAMIAKHFAEKEQITFADQSIGGAFVQKLRYGENPNQQAVWLRYGGAQNGLHKARVLQGKELSYNNLLDIDAAVSTLNEFQTKAAVVAVKHNNPCGAAVAAEPKEALELAVQADPQSVFGGILALNFEVTQEMAKFLKPIFLECIVAPSFQAAAIETFAEKKNLRLLSWPEMRDCFDPFQFRAIAGGFLVQAKDQVAKSWPPNWQILGETNLSDSVRSDLVFAWQVCAHLKSNAIAIAERGQTLGLGMGQVNRVDAVAQAIQRKNKFHAKAQKPVLASDAFFPFADSIEQIAAAGIQYVIQPGGSVKDDDVIAAAQKNGITMVLTGQRHFLH
jgi:phosphoribosylaminoimidazolecarboxamide formyltransferase/IMP cyclohydrolase